LGHHRDELRADARPRVRTDGRRDYQARHARHAPRRRHALLPLRRHRYTGTASYFLCRSPGPVPLAKLIAVAVAVARWRIEEDHQLSKQASGLDSGQVTTWASWHRPTAISLLAYAFLAVAAACQRALRRDQAYRGTWALWRRHYQYQAQQAHQRWHAYADEVPR
jgi:SRSO17 transposase